MTKSDPDEALAALNQAVIGAKVVAFSPPAARNDAPPWDEEPSPHPSPAGGRGSAAAASGSPAGVSPLRAGGAAGQKKKRAPKPPPAPDPEGDGPRTLNDYGLPELCPVTPLGKYGDVYYYLDALDQMIPLKAKEHSRNNFASMFSPSTHLLEVLWPRREFKNGVWSTKGFRPEKVTDDLMDACARRGVWNPVERVRGPGAWSDGEGGLIFHCGRSLWTHDGERATGLIDPYVYPTAPAVPAPWDDPVRGGGPYDAPAGGARFAAEQRTAGLEAPAAQLLERLKSWRWARADGAVDATLMLGWICAAMLGGALDWRPMCFVTGDAATGKSTLHALIGAVFGGGLIQSADTTAAGIYQHVGQSSLPVAIDEMEAGADNRRARAVIELARLAASGAVMLRGGADHTGVEFKARSCFLFSSILMPPLTPQDRSRMAILALDQLPRGAPKMTLAAAAWRKVGRQIKRRLIDQWPRFSDTLDAYRAALGAGGHGARGQDQFGTLLACADLALYDEAPDGDTLCAWTDRLHAERLAEIAETRSNAEACLDWLCQAQPEAWRGGSRKTVAELVAEGDNFQGSNFAAERLLAIAALGAGGLHLPNIGGQPWLAVPDNHALVGRLFEHTQWHGAAGVEGGWAQALRRLPGTVPRHVVKIGGRGYRATLVPPALINAGETAGLSPGEAFGPDGPDGEGKDAGSRSDLRAGGGAADGEEDAAEAVDA